MGTVIGQFMSHVKHKDDNEKHASFYSDIKDLFQSIFNYCFGTNHDEIDALPSLNNHEWILYSPEDTLVFTKLPTSVETALADPCLIQADVDFYKSKQSNGMDKDDILQNVLQLIEHRKLDALEQEDTGWQTIEQFFARYFCCRSGGDDDE